MCGGGRAIQPIQMVIIKKTEKGVGVMGGKGRGIKKYKFPDIKSHENVKYGIGNIVNNNVITMY